MTEKKILDSINKLNKNDSFKEIIELIEGLNEEEHTPRVLCELARAYNNLAAYEDPDNIDADLLKKSVSLLKSIENQFPENDHLLNFRLGYALFYLDRKGEALERFRCALASEPEDEDTIFFIDECSDRLTLPLFEKPFSQRIKEGWRVFSDGEEKLRELISDKADSTTITELCHKLLSSTFTDVCFEIGFNGEKYDLILSPEKNKYMLYLLDAFRKHAPENVKKHWNILLGRQPSTNAKLGFFEKQISPSEVTVTIQQRDGAKSCCVTGYCEGLSALLGANRNEALWFFDLLLDMTLGEIVNMKYVETIDLAEKPFGEEDDAFPLTKLPEIINERFKVNEGLNNAENYLDSYTAYEMKPHEPGEEDEYITPRHDVFVGFTCLTPFIEDYYNNDPTMSNQADNDGVSAGFIFYPIYGFQGDENESTGKKLLDFRDRLQEYIQEKAGDSVVFIGGASGTDNSYLDFISWDLRAVLKAAEDFLSKEDAVPQAYYQSFRTDVQCVAIKYGDDQ